MKKFNLEYNLYKKYCIIIKRLYMAIFSTDIIYRVLLLGTVSTLYSIYLAKKIGLVIPLISLNLKFLVWYVLFLPYMSLIYATYLYLWIMLLFKRSSMTSMQKFLTVIYLVTVSYLFLLAYNPVWNANFHFKHYREHNQAIPIDKLIAQNKEYGIERFILDYQKAHDEMIFAKTKEEVLKAALKKNIASDCIYRGLNRNNPEDKITNVIRKAGDIKEAIRVGANYTLERYRGANRNSYTAYQAPSLEQPKKLIEQMTNWRYPQRQSICDENLTLEEMYQKLLRTRKSKKVVQEHEYIYQQFSISMVAINENILIVGDKNRGIELWSREDNQDYFDFNKTLKKYSSILKIKRLGDYILILSEVANYTTYGRYILASFYYNEVTNKIEQQSLLVFNGLYHDWSFSEDQKRVFLGSKKTGTFVVDISNMKELKRIGQPLFPHKNDQYLINDIMTYQNNYYILSTGAGLYHYQENNRTLKLFKSYPNIKGEQLIKDAQSPIFYAIETDRNSTDLNISKYQFKINTIEKISTKRLPIELKYETDLFKNSKFYNDNFYIHYDNTIYIFDKNMKLVDKIDGTKMGEFIVENKKIIYIDNHQIKRLCLK